MHAMTFRAVCTAILATVALAASGCAADEPGGVEMTATTPAGGIRAGDRIPRPSGTTVLRVRGVRGNDGTATVMDLATLERLPRVEVRLHEPFEQRDMRFTGVRVDDLLRLSGAPSTAADVLVHALDDYQVRFRVEELTDAGAVLATRADGAPIALEDGGPIRIVFPESDGPGRNKDNWIWSVDWIRVSA